MWVCDVLQIAAGKSLSLTTQLWNGGIGPLRAHALGVLVSVSLHNMMGHPSPFLLCKNRYETLVEVTFLPQKMAPDSAVFFIMFIVFPLPS